MFDCLPQEALPYVVDIPASQTGVVSDPIDETARGHRFEHRQERTERIGKMDVGWRHLAVHRPVKTRRARPARLSLRARRAGLPSPGIATGPGRGRD